MTCETICNEANSILIDLDQKYQDVEDLAEFIGELWEAMASGKLSPDESHEAGELSLDYWDEMMELVGEIVDDQTEFNEKAQECQDCLGQHKLDSSNVDFATPDVGDFEMFNDFFDRDEN